MWWRAQSVTQLYILYTFFSLHLHYHVLLITTFTQAAPDPNECPDWVSVWRQFLGLRHYTDTLHPISGQCFTAPLYWTSPLLLIIHRPPPHNPSAANWLAGKGSPGSDRWHHTGRHPHRSRTCTNMHNHIPICCFPLLHAHSRNFTPPCVLHFPALNIMAKLITKCHEVVPV